ncbi:protein arginine kinase [Rubellicoccus peritrichatus]|uniref:Protein-arginine kinase n=1 Tax=Rubellicoccus peritrichatus TaxID=3080537 RepID=A0AAQ3QUC2_9BACT|nr:protein arginine kinase [Puniceicoccus sp. CR14]WOO42241.1 protein arginine kinase [Puniceicoccus sp. CR14]
MQIRPILEAETELTDRSHAPESVVLSTRVRLARNIDETPFPSRANKSQRREILARCQDAIAGLKMMQKGSVLEMQNLSDPEKQVLVERHLISRELSNDKGESGVIVSRDQSCAIMINEEDHLRIQVLRAGYNFKGAWKVIDRIDTGLEDKLDFAFSPEWGFLTACPTNLGTALRASVMLHLPGLVMASQMEKVVRAVNQMGIAVRGLYGEGTDASGSIFQISNQQTLGESEQDIIKRLTGVLDTVIEQEQNARQKLLENAAPKVLDKIGRAFGALQNGHLLSSAEAMNLLSLIRLGVDFGLLPENERRSVDKFFMTTQPGHIQIISQGDLENSDQRDVERARVLREHFRGLAPLDFDTLEKT